MKCPHCGQEIDDKDLARYLAAKGGRASGERKRRDVDYRALARKAVEARRKKREN